MYIIPFFPCLRCNLPPDVGRCRSHRPKYHYDAQRGECRLFFWGGCGGNENRQVESIILCFKPDCLNGIMFLYFTTSP